MQSRQISQGAALLYVVFATSEGWAEEAENMCEDPRVRIQGRTDDRWLEPIAHACEDLRSMRDSDVSARVRIVPAGHELIVEVVLKDGRSTLRRVREPAALKSTLDALLTLPAFEQPAHSPATPVTLANEINRAPASVPAPSPPQLSVELGGAVGGRISGGQMYLSVAGAGFAQLRAGDWLFGMSARWDAFQFKSDTHVDNFEMETIGAGIFVARHFHSAFGSFDMGVAPQLLAESQSFLTNGAEIADTQTDVRLGGFSRVTFGDASWRPFLEIDAELSPGRLRRDIRIDPALPPLPSWSASVSVGAVWGQK